MYHWPASDSRIHLPLLPECQSKPCATTATLNEFWKSSVQGTCLWKQNMKKDSSWLCLYNINQLCFQDLDMSLFCSRRWATFSPLPIHFATRLPLHTSLSPPVHSSIQFFPPPFTSHLLLCSFFLVWLTSSIICFHLSSIFFTHSLSFLPTPVFLPLPIYFSFLLFPPLFFLFPSLSLPCFSSSLINVPSSFISVFHSLLLFFLFTHIFPTHFPSSIHFHLSLPYSLLVYLPFFLLFPPTSSLYHHMCSFLFSSPSTFFLLLLCFFLFFIHFSFFIFYPFYSLSLFSSPSASLFPYFTPPPFPHLRPPALFPFFLNFSSCILPPPHLTLFAYSLLFPFLLSSLHLPLLSLLK